MTWCNCWPLASSGNTCIGVGLLKGVLKYRVRRSCDTDACCLVIISYKRSAALSQFVIHRGLIISSMQAVFSAVFYFISIALFPGFLLVGWASHSELVLLRLSVDRPGVVLIVAHSWHAACKICLCGPRMFLQFCVILYSTKYSWVKIICFYINIGINEI